MKRALLKKQIKKLKSQLLRDEYGNLRPLYWNKMILEDVCKLQRQLEGAETQQHKGIEKMYVHGPAGWEEINLKFEEE